MKNVIFVLFVFFVSLSCNKEFPECDSAELCVENIGSDTIYFCWGCNYYEDTLYPGEKACRLLGEMSGGTEYDAYFDSSHGSYIINVDECYEVKYIE